MRGHPRRGEGTLLDRPMSGRCPLVILAPRCEIGHLVCLWTVACPSRYGGKERGHRQLPGKARYPTRRHSRIPRIVWTRCNLGHLKWWWEIS